MHTSGAYDTVAKIRQEVRQHRCLPFFAYNPGIQEKGWNINKLPTGQILRLPSAATVNAGKMYITTGGQWSTIPRIARHEGVDRAGAAGGESADPVGGMECARPAAG